MSPMRTRRCKEHGQADVDFHDFEASAVGTFKRNKSLLLLNILTRNRFCNTGFSTCLRRSISAPGPISRLPPCRRRVLLQQRPLPWPSPLRPVGTTPLPAATLSRQPVALAGTNSEGNALSALRRRLRDPGGMLQSWAHSCFDDRLRPQQPRHPTVSRRLRILPRSRPSLLRHFPSRPPWLVGGAHCSYLGLRPCRSAQLAQDLLAKKTSTVPVEKGSAKKKKHASAKINPAASQPATALAMSPFGRWGLHWWKKPCGVFLGQQSSLVQAVLYHYESLDVSYVWFEAS